MCIVSYSICVRSSTQTFAVRKSSEDPVWLPLQLGNTPLHTLQSVDLPIQFPIVSVEGNNLKISTVAVALNRFGCDCLVNVQGVGWLIITQLIKTYQAIIFYIFICTHIVV